MGKKPTFTLFPTLHLAEPLHKKRKVIGLPKHMNKVTSKLKKTQLDKYDGLSFKNIPSVFKQTTEDKIEALLKIQKQPHKLKKSKIN